MELLINQLGDSNERLATHSQRIPILWDGLSYSAIQLHHWLLRRCSPDCNSLPSHRTLVYSKGFQMNKKHLAKLLEEARVWTNAEYETKTTTETDSYHIRQQLARLTLLQHIADNYLDPDTYPTEQRENAQL